MASQVPGWLLAFSPDTLGAIERRRDERWETRAGANRIFDQNVVDCGFFTGPRDGIGLDPIRRERGGVFFVKLLPIDSIGESLHRDRTVFQIRQNMAANTAVIVDDLALGKANLAIHDLIEIRDANVPTRNP